MQQLKQLLIYRNTQPPGMQLYVFVLFSSALSYPH
jgi:hypothetical protein